MELIGSILLSLAFVFADWKWGHFIIEKIFLFKKTSIKTFHYNDGTPVPEATVIISGSGIKKANDDGIAKFYIPRHDMYGIKVKYEGCEAGHYMLELEPGMKYVYTQNQTLDKVEKY